MKIARGEGSHEQGQKEIEELFKLCKDIYDTWSNIFLNDDHLKRFVGTLKRWTTYHKLGIE